MGASSMILKLKRTPGIFLVGFMGSGKTTVGRVLADQLGWTFHDLDEEIERHEGATIVHIFDKHGEAAFRQAETAALQKSVSAVERGRPHVISLGGGTFHSEDNFQMVSNNGVTIWLDCSLTTVERRISAYSHRPLARDPERLRELFEARRQGYGRADYRIEVHDDDAVATVERILALPFLHP
jgi:shikimate kinase